MKKLIVRPLEVNDPLAVELWKQRNEQRQIDAEKWERVMRLWGDEPTGEPIVFARTKEVP
jgi:hypothetical protein